MSYNTYSTSLNWAGRLPCRFFITATNKKRSDVIRRFCFSPHLPPKADGQSWRTGHWTSGQLKGAFPSFTQCYREVGPIAKDEDQIVCTHCMYRISYRNILARSLFRLLARGAINGLTYDFTFVITPALWTRQAPKLLGRSISLSPLI